MRADKYFSERYGSRTKAAEAIEKGLISIDDWRKKAWNIKKDEDTEVLQYENYEIAITDDAYIIRPIKKTETS